MYPNPCEAVPARPLTLPAQAPAFLTPDKPQAAIVINPTKFRAPKDLADFQLWAERLFKRYGWQRPMWFPTDPSTRGAHEAMTAVSAGADVVVAAGGDGTVRVVAEQLMGTGVPLGVLPTGTGNLLARNLGGDPGNLAAAVHTICYGQDSPIDMGWLMVDRSGQGEYRERHPFVVMAGAGFDAAIMSGASERLKRWVGRAAYVVSGMLSLRRPMASTAVEVDGRLALVNPSHGLIVGNCGMLTTSVRLMPDADPSDGQLDALVLLPRKLSEWAKLAWIVRSRIRRKSALMPAFQGTRIELRSESPQLVQVDGDVIGAAYGIMVGLSSRALLVRQPVTGTAQTPAGTSFARQLTGGLPLPV